MGIWDTLTGFVNKYGGRTNSQAASNYDNNSFGNISKNGELGYGYGDYSYTDLEKAARKTVKTPNSSVSAEDVTGNTKSHFAGQTSRSSRPEGRLTGRKGNMNETYYKNVNTNNSKDVKRSYPYDFNPSQIEQGYSGGSRRFKGKNVSGVQQDLWQTPEYGNLVYYADYDAGQGFNDKSRQAQGKEKKTEVHDTFLDLGKGRSYTYATYPTNYDGEYKKAKDKINKEWQNLEQNSGGSSFNAYDEELILETNGITMNRMKNKLLTVKRININRAPSFSEVVNFGKQYIIFSRPDLNLFVDNSGQVNPSIVQNCPDLYYKIIKNPLVAQMLQSSFGGPNRGPGGGIISLLTNMCNECSWPSMGISKKEGPKNIKGQGLSYAGDMFEAADQNELDLNFLDNRDRDIQTLFEIWLEYMEGVNNGTIMKKSLHISNNTVDYAINIWVITLDESYNILSWGMAGNCFPLNVSTDLLNYSAVPKMASELVGPFSYKFHVSYFHKPNMHRTIEMLNYTTGFTKIFGQNLPQDKASYQLTHTQVGNYWIHAGFIPYHTVLFYGYEYHFNIEDKYAEVVGVHLSYPSSGDIQYSLVFASNDVGPPRKPGSFGTNEYKFYKFDDDIEENVTNWKRWAEQHPDYYKNPANKDVIGVPLWNQEEFAPDYQAWLLNHGAKTWNERYNRGYNSSHNRYGAFSTGKSNSPMFEGMVGKVARAFGKLF